MTRALIDGQAGACVAVDDRALLYGDGLFETIAFRDGRAPLWDLHWQRFQHGCNVLGLACPEQDHVMAQCRQLSPQHGLAVIRFQLTRGSGGKAYWPAAEPRPRLIVQGRAWPAELAAQREKGLRLCTAELRLASDSPLAGLKHCNRLEQVLAARECARRDCDEALLFNGQGLLVEAIASNLVLDLGDDELVIPDAAAGVAGVGLQWLLDHAPEPIRSLPMDRRQLASVSSILVINSVTGPRPVRELDGQALSFTSRCRALQKIWIDQLW
ncbi:MAG: aminodeoxychorismate lyase [Wenzhouxiangella sp.]|nr:MAG: aminodeoxychorismate lyase [Wenzhouxiangella sp.]